MAVVIISGVYSVYIRDGCTVLFRVVALTGFLDEFLCVWMYVDMGDFK